MDNEQSQREYVGKAFTSEGMLEARRRTWLAVDDIAEAIKPGMTEPQATQLVRKMLKERGLLQGWHAICVRFGCNTMLEYGAPSKPDVVLGENDIFTLDLGPLWDGYEADSGATFVVGSDPEMLRAKTDVKVLWSRVRDVWRERALTGAGLYEFAAEEAEKLGWVFNPIMSGHRVGDFPHQYQGTLRSMDGIPSPHLWILEILIRHKTLPFGAYFEDLLT
ncbi:M24 family metallopeptidase [Ralstonia soli]|uniref:M24 family metallopeptidase n=1 Tax=Ralstonia soli TaxID=2953896 RepID=A0ABT1AEY0_9RALS|nr:M24 family metallopeptidase [Ralstonia soli]MCO5396677.1 M24 family metallopeptidase [Ralstonia soli]